MSGSDELLPRVYRLRATRIGILMTTMSLFCLALVVPLVGDDLPPTWLKALLPLVCAASLCWLYLTAKRVGTLVDSRGIEIRGFVRRTRFGWADIQDIRVVPNPAAARQQLAPAFISYVYGHNGARAQLMYVDTLHVDAEREVALLCAILRQQVHVAS
ncbi:PH domain-containing protein [Streptomyces uncialis]|uniref:PH domain-containing protein n=1 Tax=Streptomyces uncialis TaxID=1048205 RepID=UPI0038641204|nr:PH domain-containing protein [Streptomyces uncialis]